MKKVIEGYGIHNNPSKIVEYLTKLYYITVVARSIKQNSSWNCNAKLFNRPNVFEIACNNTIIALTALGRKMVTLRQINNIVEKIRKELRMGKGRQLAHIIVLTPGRFSKPSIERAIELRNEGIIIHEINYKDNPLAKLFVTCVAYYANNEEAAKKKLTADKLFELMRATLDIDILLNNRR